MTQDSDRWSFSASFFNTWSCSKHCFAIHQITSTRSQPSRSPVCLCYSVELWSSLADTPVFKSQSKFNQLTTMAPSCSSSLSFCKEVLLSPPLDWHCTEEYLVLSMKRWLCAFLFKKKKNNETDSRTPVWLCTSVLGEARGKPSATLKAYLRPHDSVSFWTALFAFCIGLFFSFQSRLIT